MRSVASVQYNGMLLLASYVQRLHVFYATLQHLENKTYPELEQQKEAFESLNAMMPMFEATKSLTMTQFDKMQQLIEQTTKAMDDYFQPLNMSQSYKIALVASTFFGEQLMNNGVIRLGKLFNEQVGPDFEKRIKFYEERTRMMQAVVHVLKEGKTPEQKILQIVDDYYNGILKRQDMILSDLQKISPMIQARFQ